MSGKLFGQIVLLIIIAVLILNVSKCLKRAFCPMSKGKMQQCQMAGK